MARRWEIVSVAAPAHRGWNPQNFAAVLAEHGYEHGPITTENGYLVARAPGIPTGVAGPQCHAPAPHHTIVLRIATVARE